MKRIVALVLVLCMALGMVVSVSAAPNSHFSRTINMVRLIRTMFAKDEDEGPAFGVEKDGKLVIYASPSGKKDASGTEKAPLTLEAARDAARKADKKDYEGIDIVLKAGNYVLKETFNLTAEDAGAKDCPVRYIGEDGATIIGGVALTAKDFAPATGDTAKYFPEAEKIVQYDLGKLGVTPADMEKLFGGRHYNTDTIRLFTNGVMQTVARYPNIGEDEITIEYGSAEHPEGRERDWVDTMTFGVSEEVIERLRTWHTYSGAFVSGYTDFLWRISNTPLTGISADKTEFYTLFPGTAAPRAGLEFYVYNVPEELDAPGEYYIDRNAILYYYPTEEFSTATISVPVVNCIMNVKDADYTTFENLTFQTSGKVGLEVYADNITIYDCVLRGMVKNALIIDGYNNLVSTNHIYNTGSDSVVMEGGDEANLVSGNNLFTNNYCHDFGLLARGYNGAISLDGCGNTISHNEIFGGEHLGIYWNGTRNVIEYNYLHDLCTIADDMGAIYGGYIDMIDCTVRYNFIENVGIEKTNPLRKIDGYPYCGSHAVYWDMYNSTNNTYGNIFRNIWGAGVAIGSGRDIYICDNLFIGCTYSVVGNSFAYTDAYFNDPAKHTGVSFPSYVKSDVWMEAYPKLSKIVANTKDTTADDPNVWCAPVDTVIKDNFTYADRYNADKNGVMGLNIKSGYYDTIRDFNPATVVDMTEANGTLVVFNSKRGGMPEIKDALETAKDVVSITYEQFLEMGTDWKPAE